LIIILESQFQASHSGIFATLGCTQLVCELATDIPTFLELGIRSFLIAVAGGEGKIEAAFSTDGVC
jgi:hypothetical protein